MNETDESKLHDQDCNHTKSDDGNQEAGCAKGCAGCGVHSGKRTATIWYIVALAAVVAFAILLSKIFA
ncbi:MAG TPA: hypothetical protein GXZ59_08610 [Clostridiaceae bacterium]|nr:hypothetical protein [Clostridiaceae bacterium]